MTLDPYIRALIRERYPSAFSYRAPLRQPPPMVVIDLMQWVKTMPEQVSNLDQVVTYLVRRCLSFMTKQTRVLVVCWDRKSPEVKQLICHGKRYSKVKVASPDEAPILPADPTTPLAHCNLHEANWLRFAGSGVNLRRELGPRLVNAFMNPALVKPDAGQLILLNGFPLKFKAVHVFENVNAQTGAPQYGVYETCEQPTPWNIDTSGDGFGDVPLTARREELNPDLYNRVLAIYGVERSEQCPTGVFYEEKPEMRNEIAEADNSIFFFDHFFPNLDQMLVINDGDAINIGLLYARERMVGPTFRNVQVVALRNAAKRKPGEPSPPAFEYCDLNELFCAMERDEQFTAAGVNNHVLPFVLLSILPGNDFFGKYCKGVGLATIVNTYLELLPFFANLLQWNNAGLAPSTREHRRIVMDEELFVQLTHHVYMNKHGKTIRKKHKKANYELLKVHLSKKKDPLPSREEIRRQCRQIQWNIDYFANALRDLEVNPYETLNGQSYYGYEHDAKTGKPSIAKVICSATRPVDEMYKRNFYKRTQKLQSCAPILNENKKRALEQVSGELDALF